MFLPMLVLAKGLRNKEARCVVELIAEDLAFRVRQIFKNITVPEY